MFIESNIIRVGLGVLALMGAGSIVRLFAVRRASAEVRSTRLKSLATWWVVAIVVIGIASLGKLAAVIAFALMSIVALREYLHLRRDDVRLPMIRPISYGLTVVSYLCLLNCWPTAFFAVVPSIALLLLSISAVLVSRTAGYARDVAEAYWGFLLTTYLPGYGVLLFCMPAESNPTAGSAGWFLFLLLITEVSDIAQALVGRKIGRKTILSRVSPHKTWTGLLGGGIVAVALASVLGGWLTPWKPPLAMAAGIIIWLAGFFGDLNISALKRDSGVKDSSNLLPGHGGMLDRIDSLSFSAPCFYWFVIVVQ